MCDTTTSYYLLDTRVIESLGGRVKEELKVYSTCLNQYQLPLITCAASLAHHGLLGSVAAYLRLYNVDLTSVPAEHLASLISCVERKVKISNNTSCVVTILDSIRCDLVIEFQSLSSEETAALVRAMESRVRDVFLYDEVTLDIGGLMDYSGQGKCKVLTTADRYREQLMTWVKSRSGCGWEWINQNWCFQGVSRCFQVRRILK